MAGALADGFDADVLEVDGVALEGFGDAAFELVAGALGLRVVFVAGVFEVGAVV